MKKFLVIAQWDGEAGVWVATSDDIPGLVTEAKSLDELLERVLAVAPELLEDNAHLIDGTEHPGDLIDVCIQSQFRMAGAHAH
jgi:predicted RNase H-like HicB family nuclease